uniref:hypothetical protein n=1 Tax=Armatimonas sp. TaxID=1872638 RepID=UPI00286CBF88
KRGHVDNFGFVGYGDYLFYNFDLYCTEAPPFGTRPLNRGGAAATLNLGDRKVTLNHVLNYTRKKIPGF